MPKAPTPKGSANAGSAGAAGRFAHLHLHSEYSLLDGGNTIRRLVDRVKELGMDSVAVTDHGNLHAAIEFHDCARAAGIKPILGIEAFVALDDRTNRVSCGDRKLDRGFHLVLLAETMKGWENLVKLSSDAFVNGLYYVPRMDKSTLEQWSDGIIAINGHLGSSLAHHLVRYERERSDVHWEAALEEARWHQSVFGPNGSGDPCFYVELQRHIPEQEAINPHLKRLADVIGAPLVVDNDAHFLLKEDHDVHDTLCCIVKQDDKDDTDRFRYPEGLYVKSPDEMSELFPEEPEALANTVAIADRCSVDLSTDANHAPVVKVVHPGQPPSYESGDLTEWFKDYCARFELLPFDAEKEPEISTDDLKEGCDAALRDLCEAGLLWRYGPEGITPKIRERLERELKILADKLISAYFLIVWDFVNWARQNGIPTNARGSGVGTMVGYVLGLSNACPEKYGLLFERFTDPDRAEYPDIDIDMCQDGRGDCIDYVKKKYGHVAQIITFGRLKAKFAIKDVARVMGFTPFDGQRLANLVPSELDITIDEALEREPKLREECRIDSRVARVMEHARALEGHARHTSVHAAGVVIATQPLDTIVPLYKPGGSDDIVTQWDGPTCERRGLLKMDFLGLRTLSTIERAKQLVRDSLSEDEIWRSVGQEPPRKGESDARAHPLDLERLVYDDQKVFGLFSRAGTDGVFQFESDGMRRLLVELQPDRLEDLIAANALFRPGPMDLIDDFVARKHGREAVPLVNEVVDHYTAETYGIMVYQEQVMQVLHHLGGVPLREAYSIIKAISKKNEKKIGAARSGFIAGSAERGMEEAQADELFDLIEKFAGYGFNKSHSTCYAIIAYQTAYLKTYFPAQYMAAVLTFESQAKKVEDWVSYKAGCRRVPWPDSTPERPHVGVDVLPPDINSSVTDFSVAFADGESRNASSGHIRFGIGAIKGAGRDAIDSIISEREENGSFRSLHEFCERVDHRKVTVKTIELLIKAGSFDTVHGIENRASMIETIPDAVGAGKQLAHDRAVGQEVLFGGPSDGGLAVDTVEMALREAPAWDRMTTLDHEKATLGFHVSGHPLDEFDEVIREYCNTTAGSLGALQQGSRAVICASINRLRPTVTKRGDRMTMLTLEDEFDSVDAVVFPEAFARFETLLEKDQIHLFCGSVDLERAQPSLQIDHVIEVENAANHLASCIEILFEDGAEDDPVRMERMRSVAGMLKDASEAAFEGHRVEPLVRVDADGSRVSLRTRRFSVVPTEDLVSRIKGVVGQECVRVVGGYIPSPPPRPKRGRPRRFD